MSFAIAGNQYFSGVVNDITPVNYIGDATLISAAEIDARNMVQTNENHQMGSAGNIYTVYGYSPKGFEHLKDTWFMYLNKYPDTLLARHVDDEQLLVIPAQSAILEVHISNNGVAQAPQAAVLSIGTVAKSTAKFLITDTTGAAAPFADGSLAGGIDGTATKKPGIILGNSKSTAAGQNLLGAGNGGAPLQAANNVNHHPAQSVNVTDYLITAGVTDGPLTAGNLVVKITYQGPPVPRMV